MALKCPTCKARFRGSTICTRCGTDLSPLMAVVHKAWLLREDARKALFQCNFHFALNWVEEAQKLHRTIQGDKILAMALLGLERYSEMINIAKPHLPPPEEWNHGRRFFIN